MKLPNWQHHSKKEQKRKLKPQALRQAKARRQALKKRLQQGDAFFNKYIKSLYKIKCLYQPTLLIDFL